MPLTLHPASGTRGSNLAFALFLLPADRRRDALVFYDFCRTVDDLADDDDQPLDARAAALDDWEKALIFNQGLPVELSRIIEQRGLDVHLLVEIVKGMKMDLEPRTYETLDDLLKYCWRAACAVGLVSIDIFGCRDPRSREYAEHLGYALQLTNILRDVKEDAERGRIYLPLDRLSHFGVSRESLLSLRPDGDFHSLMTEMAAHAEAFFQSADASLPAADMRALTSARLMGAIYSRVLAVMRADGFRVFENRYAVSGPCKLALAARTILASLARR